MAFQAPFRAEHVGSLLRPPSLLKARQDFSAERIDRAELLDAEDAAIIAAVRMQEDLGFRSITDGEYGRSRWDMDFPSQIGGIEQDTRALKSSARSAEKRSEFAPAALRISGRLELRETIFGESFWRLKNIAKTGEPKLTMPSPGTVHYRERNSAINRLVYREMESFWDDLADVYQTEISALHALGCRYIQLDDTSMVHLSDPRRRATVERASHENEDQHLVYIQVFNRAIANRPPDMTLCTHLCRGKFRSSWAATGGHDHVADALFNQLDVDGYFLEFDDRKAGGFDLLRFLPSGRKRVVLGLVSTKTPALEQKDFIKRRVEEAARWAPLEQLCLSPQCGFSPTVQSGSLSWQEQIDKLGLVVETAREIWPDA